ncbi:IclR family transcriptional regulator [Microbacterium marinilacus]|uniref:IclR family transcriptional regulator n=1 Tax=Microbacterium marinilacus TaxID=415209 RepID=A0ABP7BVW1_9MICO|nr:IclR family transcriptional regulator [Microbacterium marinilacus]MBY0688239.1 IclR family transcriptional regulator [Microbacterium marinilacus]
MQVVTRALDVLKTIAMSEAPLSLAETSALLDLPAPTVHRFLAVLTEAGYVTKDDLTRRYATGPELDAITRRSSLARIGKLAEPVLADLHGRYDETVFLTQKEGDDAVATSALVSTRPLRLTVHVGQVLPWHAAASARSLLAYLPENAATPLLDASGFSRFTFNTPQSADDVREHLKNVRLRGYDICDDELDSGVWAAASPILDARGTVLGSVTVGGPGDRIDDTLRASIIADVQSAAKSVSDALGNA